MVKDNEKYKKKPKNPIPLLYLYIYKRIVDRFRIGEEISYKYVFEAIKRVAHQIPNRYCRIVLNELEEFELIEKVKENKRAPVYEIKRKDYEDLIRNLNKIKQSTQRFKILKSDYDKLIQRIEKIENFNQKYKVLEHNYTKFIKDLEEYHYW